MGQRRSQDFCLGGHPVHFPSSLREPTAFSGGGVVAEVFPLTNQSHSLDSGTFLVHFRATCGSPAVYGHSRKFRHTSQVCLHIQTT